MVLAAPGLLSTTMGWRSVSPIFCASRRARKSEPPPGGNGTISLMALSGYVEPVWAFAANAGSKAERTRLPAIARRDTSDIEHFLPK